MTSRGFVAVALAASVLAASRSPRAQAPSVEFDAAIPFYGGRLIGFDQRGELRTATATVRPTAPASVFVTITLEIVAPFAYTRGRFREITLTDERGGVYRYRGWLTEDGWVQIDEPHDQAGDVPVLEAGQYPAIVALHFEVPLDARSLVLHYGTDRRSLSW